MYITNEIQYKTIGHGDFEKEWLPHTNIAEWWYATGFFYDEAQKLYSFQYTLAKNYFEGNPVYMLMMALTDIENGKHFYHQEPYPTTDALIINDTTVQCGAKAGVVKGPHNIKVFGTHEDWSFDLALSYGKGAYWHCDNGVLQMGLEGEKETTTYYSYTNMPTTGTIHINGKTLNVSGKSWFDKQGGSYSVRNRFTNWEWFSLRFDDDEEIMLFSFPQSNYQDGTFIPKTGTAKRLNEYTITPTDFVTTNGKRFSAAWEVEIPGVKEEKYTITPMTRGMLNATYYELLAEIKNDKGEVVGKCFVELLPGVLNELD